MKLIFRLQDTVNKVDHEEIIDHVVIGDTVEIKNKTGFILTLTIKKSYKETRKMFHRNGVPLR